MTSFEEVIAQAALPEDSVDLCLRRDLTSKFRELERRLQTASTEKANLGERSEASVIAEEMEALRREMVAASVTFRMRALPAPEFNRFKLSLPQRGKDESSEDFVSQKFYPRVVELVSRTCFDPVMTTDQVDQLVQVLSNGDWNALQVAAWGVNDDREGVPFSVAASVAMASSDGS